MKLVKGKACPITYVKITGDTSARLFTDIYLTHLLPRLIARFDSVIDREGIKESIYKNFLEYFQEDVEYEVSMRLVLKFDFLSDIYAKNMLTLEADSDKIQEYVNVSVDLLRRFLSIVFKNPLTPNLGFVFQKFVTLEKYKNKTTREKGKYVFNNEEQSFIRNIV